MRVNTTHLHDSSKFHISKNQFININFKIVCKGKKVRLFCFLLDIVWSKAPQLQWNRNSEWTNKNFLSWLQRQTARWSETLILSQSWSLWPKQGRSFWYFHGLFYDVWRRTVKNNALNKHLLDWWILWLQFFELENKQHLKNKTWMKP